MTIVPESTESLFKRFGSLINFIMALLSLVTIIVGGSILWANTKRDVQANTDRAARAELKLERIENDLDVVRDRQNAHGFRLDIAERQAADASAAARRADDKLSTLVTDVAIIKEKLLGTKGP